MDHLEWRRGFLVATIAAVAAVSGVLFGYGTGVIAGALPPIARQFGLDSVQQGALVAITLLAAGTTAPVSGMLAEVFGRRAALLSIAAVYLLGTGLAAEAPNYGILLAARLLTGAAIGAASFTAPAFIAEISPNRFRGFLVTLNQLMITIGILAAMLVTYGLSGSGRWREMFGLGVAPALVLGLGALALPESPRWLASHGREQHAHRVAARLGVTLRAQDAVAELPVAPLREAFHPMYRRVLVTGLVISVAIHLTGLNMAVYYTPSILQLSGFGASAAVLGAVWVAAVNVVMTVIAMLTVDRLGRRPLFIGGLLTMAFTASALGMLYALGTGHSIWPTVFLAIFLAAGAMGPAGVFWLYIAEIYPQRVRTAAMSLVTLAHWNADCLVAFTFLPLVAVTSMSVTLWCYAGLSVLTAGFCFCRMTETRGTGLGDTARSLHSDRPTVSS